MGRLGSQDALSPATPPSRSPIMNRAIAAALTALTALIATPAAAQTAVELAEEPLRLPSAGLTMRLPVGTETTISEAGSVVRATCAPPDQTWLLRVETRYSRNRDLSATDVADSVLQEVKKRYGRGRGERLESTEAKVLLEEDVETNESAGVGGRFYVSLPSTGGRTRQMQLYTVFSPKPGAFVSFDMICMEPAYEKAREAYEVAVATAEFADAALISAARHAAIETGATFLAGLREQDYVDAIEKVDGRLERLYLPAETGADADATELGYRRFRARVGKRGEIDQGASRRTWGAVENEEGYIVQLDFRLLQPRQTIIDVSAVYFMSRDRQREAWELRTAVKPHQAPQQLFVERGVREDGGEMTVTVTPHGGSTTFHQPELPPDGYLSQLETLLLPTLLTLRPVSAEYGFYAYASQTTSVRYREAELAAIEEGAARWAISSRKSEDAEAETSLFSESGQLLRINLPDNHLWEPVSPDKLQSLWRQKNLPG
jgi:hypothetical protein